MNKKPWEVDVVLTFRVEADTQNEAWEGAYDKMMKLGLLDKDATLAKDIAMEYFVDEPREL
jgi:hypothetical protein